MRRIIRRHLLLVIRTTEGKSHRPLVFYQYLLFIVRLSSLSAQHTLPRQLRTLHQLRASLQFDYHHIQAKAKAYPLSILQCSTVEPLRTVVLF
jgi:hypothetical protein